MSLHCTSLASVLVNDDNNCSKKKSLQANRLSDLTLQWAPEGFDSVCGTESDQQVAPVKYFDKRGDSMAQTLLTKGDVYGKQFVVFKFCQAYPTYVVTYTYPKDFTPSLTRPRTQVTGPGHSN